MNFEPLETKFQQHTTITIFILFINEAFAKNLEFSLLSTLKGNSLFKEDQHTVATI